MHKKLTRTVLTATIVFLSVFCTAISFGRDIYATSVNFNDVNRAVQSALPGDSVFLPTGTANWGTNTLIIIGGINLIGNGSGNTIIKTRQSSNNFLVAFDCSNGLASELHAIRFEGFFDGGLKYGSGVKFINGCVNFKVSRCYFTGFAHAALTIGPSSSIQKGVIYNNNFVNNYYPNIVPGLGYGVVVYGDGVFPKDINGKRPKPILGTDNSVFIEDNVFLGNRHHVASNYASRYVFRYNSVTHTDLTKNYSMVDTHGKVSWPSGSLSFEVYNNEFKTANNLAHVSRTAVGIRGGDGVIFNNKVSDKIVRTVELLSEGINCLTDSYPGIHQIRSVYIWNNENNDTKYSWANLTHGVKVYDEKPGCKSFIQQGRDYFLYPAPNYKPYPYPHPKRNIALKKPTTSSSKDKNHPSSMVVDGNLSKNKWWAANPFSNAQWWQVDLTDVYAINEIVVIPYYDGTRYYRYTVQTSLDGVKWKTIINKNSTNIATESGDIYTGLNTIHARFLKVNMTYNSSSSAVHLLEFEAFGHRSNKANNVNNIALYKPTKASKASYGKPSSAVVDNDFSETNWWGTFPLKEWWQVDLTANYDVKEIVVTNYYADHRDYQYQIQASFNGLDWETVAIKNNNSKATKAGDTFYFSALKARYLRVVTTGNSANNAGHIVEFRAYGSLSKVISGAKQSVIIVTSSEDFYIYPNPITAGDLLTIRLNTAGAQNVHIKVTSIHGQVITEQFFSSKDVFDKIELSTANFSKGLNLVYLTTGGKTTFRKVINNSF